MGHLFKTDGIILKSMKYSESDKILTIFSKKYGKIKAIAKGIRKTKSKFGSSLENLTVVEIMAFKGRNLNIISQTEILHSFFPICKDIGRYGLAVYCAEMVDRLIAEEDPNGSIYELLETALMLLKDADNPLLLAESFKWKLFVLLGYQPELNRCVLCNKQLKKTKYYNFNIPNGGIICQTCQGENHCPQIKITDYCLRLIKRMIAADLTSIHNKKVLQPALYELIRITEQYMLYHFEIENRSIQFLNKLKQIHIEK